MKACTKCGITKPFESFHKKGKRKGKEVEGYRPQCKNCFNLSCTEWRQSNKEYKSKINKEWYYKNQERRARTNAEWYQKNKEHSLQRYAEWSQNNKEHIAKRQAKWYRKNKERVALKCKNNIERKEQAAKWYQKNKELIAQKNKTNRKHINKQQRLRRKDDIIYKISGNLRSHFYGKVIKPLKHLNINPATVKSDSVINLLGCSLEFFRDYIADQWQPGMAWDNHGAGFGTWQLDHIKPASMHNLLEAQEQRDCYHYTNIQPKWTIDNLSKHNIFNWADEFKRDLNRIDCENRI